ncbi:Zn-ribbon domain-containing OB-fold protein [Streptomyces viridiviolaceus]
MTIAKPGPTAIPLTEPFWAAASRGEVLLQRCNACGHHQHYPRALCSRCWQTELDWVSSSGRGRVWTYTVVHRPGHPAWADDVPYVLAIVELSEGPRLLTNLVEIQPEDVTTDMQVQARFTSHEPTSLIHFEPAAG